MSLKFARRNQSVQRNCRTGFTMVETMIAVMFVAMSAMIVAAAMPIANVSRARAQQEDQAVGVVQKEVEAIRGIGFADITPATLVTANLIDSVSPVNGTTNTYSFTNSDSGNFDSPSNVLPMGQGTVQIDSLNFNLVQVVVTVTWSDRGQLRTYSSGTLVANL